MPPLRRFQTEPADAKRRAKECRSNSGRLVNRLLCPGELRGNGLGRAQAEEWVGVAMIADLVSGACDGLGQPGMAAYLRSALEERRRQAVLLKKFEDGCGAGTRSIVEGERDRLALSAAAIDRRCKPVGRAAPHLIGQPS